jgi:PII-like signaling protein
MSQTKGQKTESTGIEPSAGDTFEAEGSLVWATMVRVYLTESDRELKPLLKCLHDELRVCGATVMRGVAGFGASGVVHSARLVDLSVDLPLVLEFFDRPDRARIAIERIKDFVEPGHVVSWSVNVESNRPD